VISTVALIVAAGRGHRLPGERPKQYRELAGRTLLRWSAVTLSRHPAIERVQIVYIHDDEAAYNAAVQGLNLSPPVAGGETRQMSVFNGLSHLSKVYSKDTKVLIHDGARPFVDAALLDRVISGLDRHDAVVPALPVSDTLKRASDDIIDATVERRDLWRAQTPQGFRLGAIYRAHQAALDHNYTDDAAVAEAAGIAVHLVEGSEDNVKITTADDLVRAERWVAGSRESRVGTGFDVHRFVPGDKVNLAGVPIAHGQSLVGHSDADVVLHAVTDALLGALGAADIGEHFPPSDPTWRGADSRQFVSHALALLAARGGRLSHLDVTIICERPKIAPHRAAMVANLAALLGVAASRISVKATTTEGLGFTGRGEGIAAQATATITVPVDLGDHG